MLMEGKQKHLQLKHISKLNKLYTGDDPKDLKLDFEELPISCGLAIERVLYGKDNKPYNIVIAFVYYSIHEEDCYIETIGDRLQTYVAEYEEWQDFIMLVDEAFRLIKLNNGVEDYENSNM